MDRPPTRTTYNGSASVAAPPSVAERRPVPVRAIAVSIGLVVATALLLLLVVQVERVLIWILIALFFAVTLYPVVGWVERHLPGRRRALATLVVFFGVLVVMLGL